MLGGVAFGKVKWDKAIKKRTDAEEETTSAHQSNPTK